VQTWLPLRAAAEKGQALHDGASARRLATGTSALRCATAPLPRIQQSKTAPVVAQSAPGRVKAARQPIACASAPAPDCA